MYERHTVCVSECMCYMECVCVCRVVLFCVCEAAMKGGGQGPTNHMRGLLICIINC